MSQYLIMTVVNKTTSLTMFRPVILGAVEFLTTVVARNVVCSRT